MIYLAMVLTLTLPHKFARDICIIRVQEKLVALDKSAREYAEVSEARNQPTREVFETIGLVEWNAMGKGRRGDPELEQKISGRRRR